MGSAEGAGNSRLKVNSRVAGGSLVCGLPLAPGMMFTGQLWGCPGQGRTCDCKYSCWPLHRLTSSDLGTSDPDVRWWLGLMFLQDPLYYPYSPPSLPFLRFLEKKQPTNLSKNNSTDAEF